MKSTAATPDPRRYWDAELRKQILSFRPQNEPGHDVSCGGITEGLEIVDGACVRCRCWLRHLLSEGKVFGSEPHAERDRAER
jgi:hypothetical protein